MLVSHQQNTSILLVGFQILSSFSRTCLCDCGRSTATFVTWLDNYSHTFHRSVPRVSKKDYKEMLWAVEARLVSVSVVDFTLLYDANNDVVPVMPRNFFEQDTVDAVISRVCEAEDQSRASGLGAELLRR